MSMSKDKSEYRLDYSAFDKALTRHYLKNNATNKIFLSMRSEYPVKEAMINAIDTEL